MDLDLTDRVYLVTGGSRGLGRACAQVLVDERARVVLASRNEASAQGTAAAIGNPDRVLGIVGDLADPASAERMVQTAVDRFGRLDGAVISVGGPPAASAMTATDDQWRGAFESVFLGALRTVRTVARACLDGGRGGSIVMVLSTSVKQPIGGLAISNGLRPGLAMTAKTLADELGPQGVRVNALLPGSIDTDRLRELNAASGDQEGARRATEARIPLRRYGTPEEFARAAVFVLSPAAGYVNGSILAVDGGASRGL